MRPFGEPEKVAFESLSDRLMDKREAAENRRNEFWGALGESLLVKIKPTIQNILAIRSKKRFSAT